MHVRQEEFDRRFDEVIIPDSDAMRELPDGSARKRVESGDEIKIRKAMSLFYRGEYRGCINAMLCLEQGGVADSRIGVFRAASRALALGDTKAGLRSCIEAVRAAEPVPDVFCALGAVLLGAGDRAGAHAMFQKGLSLDPFHPYLRVRMRSLGVRKSPVLASLPRAHPVNRVLGALRARLEKF